MKAMLLSAYKRLELTDMPHPELEPDGVLIRVRSCGICGSDVHGYDGSTGRRIPPIVMGHEAAGTVEAVGAAVKDLPAGTPVTFDSMISCGRCGYCRSGFMNLCDKRRVLGVSCGEYRQHGAFAEFVAVPRHVIYEIPEGVSFDQAAMVEPVSIAVHAVNLTPRSLGENAVVYGCGMIGLMCLQALRAAGFTRVWAVDPDATRRERAIKLGASAAFDSKTQNVPAEIIALTSGRGADVALEAVGATEPITAAIASVRKGGAVTLVGNIQPKIELPLQQVVTREIKLIGTCGSNGEYPQCLQLMQSGAIVVDDLITAAAPLEEGPRWFERLYSHEPGLMKVILKP